MPPDLPAFGPLLRGEQDLRHAVRRPPPRLIIDIRLIASALLDAALPVLRHHLAVVVLSGRDAGMLVQRCDRVLVYADSRWTWMPADVCRAQRCLEYRVEGPRSGHARWVRVPMDGVDGAETALAAARADGVRVRESRIVYARGVCVDAVRGFGLGYPLRPS
jgi:hypothetical protein